MTTEPALTLKFDRERRRMPRRPVKGHAMGVFSLGPAGAKLVRVELVDASWTGIGVTSSEPVEVGTSVSLTPEDAMWPRQTGVVVRCDAAEGGYRVGLLSRQQRAVA
jgi:hypothetical protein